MHSKNFYKFALFTELPDWTDYPAMGNSTKVATRQKKNIHLGMSTFYWQTKYFWSSFCALFINCTFLIYCHCQTNREKNVVENYSIHSKTRWKHFQITEVTTIQRHPMEIALWWIPPVTGFVNPRCRHPAQIIRNEVVSTKQGSLKRSLRLKPAASFVAEIHRSRTA